MFYALSKADWLSKNGTRSVLYRHVRVPFLTLGHWRTLEVLENSLVASDVPTEGLPMRDVGQMIAGAQVPWRTFRRQAERASLSLSLRTLIATPRTADELCVACKWFFAQFRFPSQIGTTDDEQRRAEYCRARAADHAATPAMRYALTACTVPGWQSITGVQSVWDMTLPQLRHLILAKSENDGAYHLSRDLLEEATHGRKG